MEIRIVTLWIVIHFEGWSAIAGKKRNSIRSRSSTSTGVSVVIDSGDKKRNSVVSTRSQHTKIAKTQSPVGEKFVEGKQMLLQGKHTKSKHGKKRDRQRSESFTSERIRSESFGNRQRSESFGNRQRSASSFLQTSFLQTRSTGKVSSFLQTSSACASNRQSNASSHPPRPIDSDIKTDHNHNRNSGPTDHTDLKTDDNRNSGPDHTDKSDLKTDKILKFDISDESNSRKSGKNLDTDPRKSRMNSQKVDPRKASTLDPRKASTLDPRKDSITSRRMSSLSISRRMSSMVPRMSLSMKPRINQLSTRKISIFSRNSEVSKPRAVIRLSPMRQKCVFWFVFGVFWGSAVENFYQSLLLPLVKDLASPDLASPAAVPSDSVSDSFPENFANFSDDNFFNVSNPYNFFNTTSTATFFNVSEILTRSSNFVESKNVDSKDSNIKNISVLLPIICAQILFLGVKETFKYVSNTFLYENFTKLQSVRKVVVAIGRRKARWQKFKVRERYLNQKKSDSELGIRKTQISVVEKIRSTGKLLGNGAEAATKSDTSKNSSERSQSRRSQSLDSQKKNPPTNLEADQKKNNSDAAAGSAESRKSKCAIGEATRRKSQCAIVEAAKRKSQCVIDAVSGRKSKKSLAQIEKKDQYDKCAKEFVHLDDIAAFSNFVVLYFSSVLSIAICFVVTFTEMNTSGPEYRQSLFLFAGLSAAIQMVWAVITVSRWYVHSEKYIKEVNPEEETSALGLLVAKTVCRLFCGNASCYKKCRVEESRNSRARSSLIKLKNGLKEKSKQLVRQSSKSLKKSFLTIRNLVSMIRSMSVTRMQNSHFPKISVRIPGPQSESDSQSQTRKNIPPSWLALIASFLNLEASRGAHVAVRVAMKPLMDWYHKKNLNDESQDPSSTDASNPNRDDTDTDLDTILSQLLTGLPIFFSLVAVSGINFIWNNHGNQGWTRKRRELQKKTQLIVKMRKDLAKFSQPVPPIKKYSCFLLLFFADVGSFLLGTLSTIFLDSGSTGTQSNDVASSYISAGNNSDIFSSVSSVLGEESFGSGDSEFPMTNELNEVNEFPWFAIVIGVSMGLLRNWGARIPVFFLWKHDWGYRGKAKLKLSKSRLSSREKPKSGQKGRKKAICTRLFLDPIRYSYLDYIQNCFYCGKFGDATKMLLVQNKSDQRKQGRSSSQRMSTAEASESIAISYQISKIKPWSHVLLVHSKSVTDDRPRNSNVVLLSV